MICNVCNTRHVTGMDINFFSFPLNNPEKLEKWLENLPSLKNWKPTKNSRICSRHFTEREINRHGDRCKLHPFAVPTLNLQKNMAAGTSDKRPRSPIEIVECYMTAEDSDLLISRTTEKDNPTTKMSEGESSGNCRNSTAKIDESSVLRNKLDRLYKAYTREKQRNKKLRNFNNYWEKRAAVLKGVLKTMKRKRETRNNEMCAEISDTASYVEKSEPPETEIQK